MHVIVKVQIKPEHIAAYEAGMAALIPEGRKEEGCLKLDVYKDDDNPGAYVLVEEWTSEEALQSHFRQPYVTAVRDNYPEWSAAPPVVMHVSPFS